MTETSQISPKNHNIHVGSDIFSNIQYYGNGKVVDNSSEKRQNLEPPIPGGLQFMSSSRRKSVPNIPPPLVEMYYLRFVNATFSEDLRAIIDELWNKERRLNFDEKLEVIYRITTWDDYEFDVDSFDMDHYRACDFAIVKTLYREAARPFVMRYIHELNYPSQYAAARELGRFVEAQESLERLMNESNQWEIIAECKSSLRYIYQKRCPERLHELDFDIADRANSSTQYNWDRAMTMEWIQKDALECFN